MHSIGRYEQQAAGYKAFIPNAFPPTEQIAFSSETALKHSEAMRLVGKLDGLSFLLPDKDFFLLMFVRKEAASSSHIEGTRATLVDAIEAEIESRTVLPGDVSDIIHYISALNHGLQRIKTLPLSTRLICEIHDKLMRGARSTQNPFPGELRRSQNWVNGTSPSHARFVPPPPHEIPRALSDLEKFIHAKEDGYLPLIKAALIHAQFETIHPFVDGNGRTGRLLVSLFLWQEQLLNIPLLYLSDFFWQHQSLYYDYLQAYHSEPAEIVQWVNFFLEGVIHTAQAAIKIALKISKLREQDMSKLHTLGKAAATTAIQVLRNLYRQPMVDAAKIEEWTGFTRVGAQKVIDRLVELGILVQHNPKKTYGRIYGYKEYLQLFQQTT